MRQSFLVLGVLLFASQGLLASTRGTPQEENKTEEHKITQEDIARTNPVKPTPEGLAAARRVFGYDCAMCHGAQGDGKGDLVREVSDAAVNQLGAAAGRALAEIGLSP